MGKHIDRVMLYLLVFGAGLVYFQSTIRVLFVSVMFSLALSALVYLMWRALHPADTSKPRARRRIQLASRNTAPRCALYGVLYLALYLLMGSIIYLPLSLILLFLAVTGFRKSGAQEAEA